MRRLAGVRVFAPTAAHRARMCRMVRCCSAHMRMHPYSVKRPSIFWLLCIVFDPFAML
jgi:hypothetical protein